MKEEKHAVGDAVGDGAGDAAGERERNPLDYGEQFVFKLMMENAALKAQVQTLRECMGLRGMRGVDGSGGSGGAGAAGYTCMAVRLLALRLGAATIPSHHSFSVTE
jgi:hypothetical protein